MLVSLSIDIRKDAERLGFEVRCAGGLLKLFPIDVPTRVLLALDESDDPEWIRKVRIWRHRNDALTRKFKGRTVTKEWVRGFMEANSEAAKEYTSRAQQQAQERERKRRAEIDAARLANANKAKRRRVPGTSRICPYCLGFPSTSFRTQDEGPELIGCGHCEAGYLHEYRVMTDEEYYNLVSRQFDQDGGSEQE